MENSQAFIVSACRTPIARFLGSLQSFSAVQLGSLVVTEAVRRAGIAPEAVQEVILGNVISAGLGQNPARQAALKAGLPVSVAAFAVNKVCGSGLKAVLLAGQAVRLQEAEVVVAGGMESMTNAPYLLPAARHGYRMGSAQIVDSMIHDGLWDACEQYHMGCTAEVVAAKYNISRAEQDEYAWQSHGRALAAIRNGHFQDEIVPVEIHQRGGEIERFDRDEGPREETSLESLGRLEAVFKENGTVTAGNASQLSDGAAAVVVMSERALKEWGCRPLARIVASCTTGIEPALVMMAPVGAVRKVRQRAGWDEADVDLYEINEAFAAQSVALSREIPVERSKMNVQGGAVALGHPIGASGARILATLLYALRCRGLKRGIASLCLGGGNAVAAAVELV